MVIFFEYYLNILYVEMSILLMGVVILEMFIVMYNNN